MAVAVAPSLALGLYGYALRRGVTYRALRVGLQRAGYADWPDGVLVGAEWQRFLRAIWPYVAMWGPLPEPETPVRSPQHTSYLLYWRCDGGAFPPGVHAGYDRSQGRG